MNLTEFQTLSQQFDPVSLYIHIQQLSKKSDFVADNFIYQYICDHAKTIGTQLRQEYNDYNSLLLQSYRWAFKNHYVFDDNEQVQDYLSFAFKQQWQEFQNELNNDLLTDDEYDDELPSEEELIFLKKAKATTPLQIYQETEKDYLSDPEYFIPSYVIRYILSHIAEIKDYILQNPIDENNLFLTLFKYAIKNPSPQYYEMFEEYTEFLAYVFSHSISIDSIGSCILAVVESKTPDISMQNKIIENIQKTINVLSDDKTMRSDLNIVILNLIRKLHEENNERLEKYALQIIENLNPTLISPSLITSLINIGYSYNNIIDPLLSKIKKTNPTYYKDTKNWSLILLSNDSSEINKILQYLETQQETKTKFLFLKKLKKLQNHSLGLMINNIDTYEEKTISMIMKQDISAAAKNSHAQYLLKFYAKSKNVNDLKNFSTFLNHINTFHIEDLIASLTLLQKKLNKVPQNISDETFRAILLKTNPNQSFALNDDNIEIKKNQLSQLRITIAKQYYLTKTTEYTYEDWMILSDPKTLANFHYSGNIPIIDIINKALNQALEKGVNIYFNKDSWIPILISGNQDAINKLNAYVAKGDEYDITCLARMHEKIRVYGLSDNDYHLTEQKRLLQKAAVRGNKYAFEKLQYLELKPQEYQTLNKIKKDLNDIDNHIAFLQDALHAKNLRRFQYLLSGSKKSIQQQIQSLTNEKRAIVQLYENMLPSSENASIISFREEASKTRKYNNHRYKRQQNIAKAMNITLSIMTFGLYNLYHFAQNKAANLILQSSPMQGSGYQFWQKNYPFVVDAFEGLNDDLLKKCETNKLEEQQAQQQLTDEKNKLEAINQKVLSQNKTKFQKFFKLKTSEEKELAKAQERVQAAEKQVYRLQRDYNSMVNVSWYHTTYPGLETEERTIVTEDGKHIDVLIINNKAAAAKNGGKAKDLVHFSGSGCFYQLEDRHFQHALAKGCNLIVVQDRVKSAHSRAIDTSKNDLAQDGCAAVKAIMEIRKQEYQAKGLTYEESDKPIIHGYCGGGPISVLTYQQLAKEGISLKYIADRTFKATSEVVKSMYDNFYSDKSKKELRTEKIKKWFVHTFTKPLLVFLGWENNNAQIIASIPEDQKIYVDVRAPQNNPNNLYHDDYVLPKNISIHEGLMNIRKHKINILDEYLAKLNTIEKVFNNKQNIAIEDKRQILNAIFSLKYTIDYIKASFEATQVLSEVDNAHVAATSNFSLPDKTSLDDMLFDFIHSSPTDNEVVFTALANTNDSNKLEQDEIFTFWQQSNIMFNEFYNQGKRMQHLHHGDHDLRMRINNLFNAINIPRIKNIEQQAQEKTSAKSKPLDLRAKPVTDFYSPEFKFSDIYSEKKEENEEKPIETSKKNITLSKKVK